MTGEELLKTMETRRDGLKEKYYELQATIRAQLSQNAKIPAISRMQAANAGTKHLAEEITVYETAMRVVSDILMNE